MVGVEGPVTPHDPAAVVRRFLDAINAHSVDDIGALLTADHVFVDAAGGEVRGRAPLRTAWAEYFRMFPDYRVHADRLFADGPDVAVFGTAEATYRGTALEEDPSHWSSPTAWRATVRGERIALWQVYTDTAVVREIMRRTDAGDLTG